MALYLGQYFRKSSKEYKMKKQSISALKIVILEKKQPGGK
jgi:hypothetical protein